MNSNTQNQIINKLPHSIPSRPTSKHLVPHLSTPIHDPTTADFERLIRQYEQYFFNLLDQHRNYPRSPTQTFIIKK